MDSVGDVQIWHMPIDGDVSDCWEELGYKESSCRGS